MILSFSKNDHGASHFVHYIRDCWRARAGVMP
jgi:hypothetical protein